MWKECVRRRRDGKHIESWFCDSGFWDEKARGSGKEWRGGAST